MSFLRNIKIEYPSKGHFSEISRLSILQNVISLKYLTYFAKGYIFEISELSVLHKEIPLKYLAGNIRIKYPAKWYTLDITELSILQIIKDRSENQSGTLKVERLENQIFLKVSKPKSR
jgi:hypothetical protein